MNTINELGFIFGAAWVEKEVFPTLVSFENNENYLFRQIPLIAFRYIAPCLNASIYSDEIFPILSTFATDKVINIRMNVSRVIIAFAKHIKGSEAEDKTVSLLNALKNDPEFDVSYYAKQALRLF
jgi:serine/threonine-protein phosphatase 2A regulatory subunit A